MRAVMRRPLRRLSCAACAQLPPTEHHAALPPACRDFIRSRHANLTSTTRAFHRHLSRGVLTRDLLSSQFPELSVQEWRPAQALLNTTSCSNVHIVVPSARGDGAEAIALVTPISQGCTDDNNFTGSNPARGASGSHGMEGCWARQTAQGGAVALGVGMVLASYLSEAEWLSRNFVWIIPDARCGLVDSVEQWLQAYQGVQSTAAGGGFERAGAIQQVGATLADTLLAGLVAAA
jgi:hypothetical protein